MEVTLLERRSDERRGGGRDLVPAVHQIDDSVARSSAAKQAVTSDLTEFVYFDKKGLTSGET